MSKVNYYHDLDLDLTEIQKVIIENISGTIDPSGKEGRIYYNSTSKTLRLYNGTSWGDVGNIKNVTGTQPIIAVVTDGVANISMRAVSVTESGYMSASDKVKLDGVETGATKISTDSDLTHNPSGDNLITSTQVAGALSELDSPLNTHINVASNPHSTILLSNLSTDIALGTSDTLVSSQKAIKTYVDTIATSSGRPAVPFDPTTAAGSDDLPLSYDTPQALGGVENILTGDQFIISVAGTVGASLTAVNPNDILIAAIDMTADDAATQLEANWTIIVAATVLAADAAGTILGTVYYAQTSDMDDVIADNPSTADELVVSPELIRYLFNTTNLPRAFSQTSVNIPVSPGININHSLNTFNVIVQVYDSSNNKISVEITLLTADQVTLIATPAVNNCRVVIQGI